MIEIKKLSINYAENIVLKNFDFSLEPGDFIGVLGSNGSGKSTLLNALVGVFPNKQGDIIYNDQYLNKNHPFSSIGFSPQTQVMDWYLDVWNNVELGLNLANTPKKLINEYCEFAIEIVSLQEKKKAIVDTLSGGQQQRVQIARAIAHKPNIYILDEPTTGLDVESSEKLLTYLSDEAKLKKKGVIISTHDITLLEKYCTKILFIKDGLINYFGNKEDFLKEQLTRFLVEFEESLKKEDLLWLDKNITTYKKIGSHSIEVYKENTPENTTFSVIKMFPDSLTIKNISAKTVNLRETYLSKVSNKGGDESEG